MESLPADRTFVLKLSTDADCAQLVGRMEHVTSGASAPFDRIEQLAAFIVLPTLVGSLFLHRN